MTLTIVGAATSEGMEESVASFQDAGFRRIYKLDDAGDDDVVLGVTGDSADLLSEADRRGLKYVLVHEGGDDHHPGGTFERAHHRIAPGERKELAKRLHGRERPLVSCLAFGYKSGAPADATLLIDARFLDNPYWVPELKDLSGHERPVVDFVLNQPAAQRLLDDVERMVHELAPLFARKGRMTLVVAFGCTGGRHRSVVLAEELARRLKETGTMDVVFTTRDLD